LGPAEKRIEKAVAIDETFHFAGPLRVWARLTHLKPFVLGGNLNHALEIYRRAVQVAPDNSTTLLYYAQALIADRQPGLARQVLTLIIDAPEDAAWKWEQARDKRIAREELGKI
jgi:cytochrome c-type biogenesis protein CcmH/NrfG